MFLSPLTKGIIGDSLKAFTLIELLVVSTILILLTISGVFYFYDFVKNQEIVQKLSLIEDDFENLEKLIKNYEIYDYEVKLSTSGHASNFYITKKNAFDVPNQELVVMASGSWIISNNASGTGYIKIYKKQKLYLYDSHTGSTNYRFDFHENDYYTIQSTLSGTILNDLELHYFHPDNLVPEKNNSIILSGIYSWEDKTGNSYSGIKIINVGWKKSFTQTDGTPIVSDILYLYFENNGLEKFIQIEK